MTLSRHIAVISLEHRRAVKDRAEAAVLWGEMLALASDQIQDGDFDWARWYDLTQAALTRWITAWQASIDAGRLPDAATFAKLVAHRDGLRALRLELYCFRELDSRTPLSGQESPVEVELVKAAMAHAAMPAPPVLPAVSQGNLL